DTRYPFPTLSFFFFFFFIATAPTYIYTLSLHDALPIYESQFGFRSGDLCLHRPPRRLTFCRPTRQRQKSSGTSHRAGRHPTRLRSEEHTSELQSRGHLVCRLLLEKKKQK